MLGNIFSKIFSFLGIRDALRMTLEGVGYEAARKAAEKVFFEEKGWDNEILARKAIFAAQTAGIISADEAEMINRSIHHLRNERNRFGENACIIIAGVCGEESSPLAVEIKRPDGTVVRRFRRAEAGQDRFALLRWLARNEAGQRRSQEEITQLLRELGASNPFPYGPLDSVKEWAIHEGPSRAREVGRRIESLLFWGGVAVLVTLIIFIFLIFSI